MPPPIFGTPQTDGTPQDYMHRARMFMRAVYPMADYVGPDQNWPKYALVGHAAELALKAFVRQKIDNGASAPAQRPANHDLTGWYDAATAMGLVGDPRIEQDVRTLSNLHRVHFARYPQRSTGQVQNLSLVVSSVDDLISAVTRHTNPA